MFKDEAKEGRPSKYTPELLDMAREYIDGGWKDTGRVIPSHIGLALHLGISTSALYSWGKDDEKSEFVDILARIMGLQHEELINNGLTGDFNSAITKLVLGKHGYHERQEVDMSAKVDTTASVTFVGVK